MLYKILAKLDKTLQRLKWEENDYKPPKEYSYGDTIIILTMYPIAIFFKWLENQLDKTAARKKQ